MARVLLIGLVVVLAAGGWAVAARAWASGSRRVVGDPRRAIDDPAVHRNHQAMARWIDARVGDDLVRPLLPESEQQKAKALLAEFYGDDG
ncbi:MAG: hypothetical protein H0W25_18580 [Acidimicrobiia bacterium]|nr:hypothetical protein [Acidimicrobiia bacterium]